MTPKNKKLPEKIKIRKDENNNWDIRLSSKREKEVIKKLSSNQKALGYLIYKYNELIDFLKTNEK